MEKELSKELDLEIKAEAGKVKLIIKYEGSGGAVALEAALKAEYFGEKLKAAIPGQIDDMVIDAVIAAFLK